MIEVYHYAARLCPSVGHRWPRKSAKLGHLFSPKASPTFLWNVEVLQEKKRQFMRFGMHHGLLHNEKCRANANDGSVCGGKVNGETVLRRLIEIHTVYLPTRRRCRAAPGLMSLKTKEIMGHGKTTAPLGDSAGSACLLWNPDWLLYPDSYNPGVLFSYKGFWVESNQEVLKKVDIAKCF